ncbi:hypothetical protein ACFVWY_08705 [Streptomyces sp. NPDC058195]|uniref:hypothetical protein n=1 Tax=Streptomyces sp. NPDC058195 TaxID=3346375 RepID=UPI0036F029F9
MNARDELYAVLRVAGEDRAEAERLIAAHDAEVLREAADVIVNSRGLGTSEANRGANWAAALLRRLANKTAAAARLARLEDARHTLQQAREQGGAQ